MATSGAVLTGVADLETAPEVTQTKPFYYEVGSASAQAFPSIHLLEGSGLRDAIDMTYSDGARRFCRPFLWSGTVMSMVG